MISVQYCAGFFDGEGSVTVLLSQSRSLDVPTPHVRLAVSNYIVEPLLAIKKRWGGSLHKARRGDVWALNLNGERARVFLKAILPYLIIKREAAEAALKVFEYADDPYQRLRWAKAVMDATRKGYRAARSDLTYNRICAALDIWEK